jgi:hypothetical protein
MSSYRCKVYKHLWKTPVLDDHYVRLSKVIEIPFVPTIRIELQEGDWHCDQIERVIWDNKEGMFTLLEVGRAVDESSVEVLTEHHISLGWEVAHKNT